MHGRLADSTWQMERLYNNMVNMGNRILLARSQGPLKRAVRSRRRPNSVKKLKLKKLQLADGTTAKSMDGLLCSPISICFVSKLTTSQDPVGNNNTPSWNVNEKIHFVDTRNATLLHAKAKAEGSLALSSNMMGSHHTTQSSSG